MSCIKVPNILMPKAGTDLYKWSVVACDQFTSQPEYWKETAEIAGDAPSTLKLILPEVYLEDGDTAARAEAINETMRTYLSDGTLTELPPGFMLVERRTGDGPARKGLVVSIDLEQYSYNETDYSLIRPTEKTVIERIPPRLAVRKGAPVEVPHIMVLIDDPDRTVIEPFFEETDRLDLMYDTDLMQKGGHIRGWFIPEGPLTSRAVGAVDALLNRADFNRKYGLTKDYPMLNMAVGDGNHSLATAKAGWKLIRQTLTEEEREIHPARYCLCELVNVHDESLIIEPIHRAAFHVDPEDLFAAAEKFFAEAGCQMALSAEPVPEDPDTQVIPCFYGEASAYMVLKHPKWGITLGSLQAFLDSYLETHKEVKLDYIHGDDVVKKLGREPGNMAFLLPALKKQDLFRGVIMDGVLPRKTFSMGEAFEKRYYMEAKRI